MCYVFLDLLQPPLLMQVVEIYLTATFAGLALNSLLGL